MNPIVSWLVALLASFSPPADHAESYQRFLDAHGWDVAVNGPHETEEERAARYAGIAADAYLVAFDPTTKPLFGGKRGRAQTAALLLAVAFHESGFAPDVDKGPCFRGGATKGRGIRSRCDGGRATCMLQIWMGPNGKTPEGWTQQDLFDDRTKCFRAGLRGLRASHALCRKKGNAKDTLFAAYASGSCGKGHKGARELYRDHRHFLRRLPVPDDVDANPLVAWK